MTDVAQASSYVKMVEYSLMIWRVIGLISLGGPIELVILPVSAPKNGVTQPITFYPVCKIMNIKDPKKWPLLVSFRYLSGP